MPLTKHSFSTESVVTGATAPLFPTSAVPRPDHQVVARKFVAELALGLKGIAVVILHSDLWLRGTDFLSRFIPARSTMPIGFAGLYVGVFNREFMSSNAMTLGRVNSNRGIRTVRVDLRGHWL